MKAKVSPPIPAQNSAPAASSRSSAQPSPFADNRAGTTLQYQLSDTIDGSVRVGQLRALTQGFNRGADAIAPVPTNASPTATPPVVRQLYVAPVVAPLGGFGNQPSYDQVRQAPAHFGLLVDINWVSVAQQTYEYITAIRQTLEDDDDLETLAAQEAQADALVTRGNGEVAQFEQTPRFERISIAERLSATRIELNTLLALIQQNFSLNEGGFSAKGRATRIDGTAVGPGQRGLLSDNRFIRNISLDGTALTANVGVSKPATVAVAGPQRLRINGAMPNAAALAAEKLRQSQIFSAALAAPAGSNTTTSTFVGVARGGTQEGAMNSTNARGYAWATNTAGWDATRWEWLHIRGASLGGVTGPTNLVLGTRDANTHMIPFESNLKTLAKVARDNPDYRDVTVAWSIGAKRHRINSIRLPSTGG